MKRASLVGPIIKSLIFMVVTALLTAVLAFSIANTSLGSTHGYAAIFTDATGLNSGDSVRIAGVRVGQIDSISIYDRREAKVRFSVESARTLPASTTATLKYLNIVGERYLDLEQGSGAITGDLRPGGTIPVDRTTPAVNLTELFNGFQPLFAALSPKDVNQLSGEIVQVLQGESTTVDSLISTVGQLSTTVAQKDKVIGQVITDLSSVVQTVNAQQANFTDLIQTFGTLVHGFALDREPLGNAIQAISGLTTATGNLLAQGRPAIKADIAQLGRLSTNLNDNKSVVAAFLKKLPVKLRTIGRLASYGSWINFYFCEASLKGAQWLNDPENGVTPPSSAPPTGIPATADRCKS